MEIEKEVLERTRVDFGKLINYGFQKKNGMYYYSKIFMDGFRAEITVDSKGELIGKVYDLAMEEEYINFRIESQVGEFVSNVRKSYKELLEEIKAHCFKNVYFVSSQANRIADSIIKLYHDEPLFPWESEGHGVFKNPDNEKWYGLIMYVDRSKIDKKKKGKVEAINLKLSPKKILELLKKDGFYKAYHMNKKNWITIILDDTVDDEEIMEYIAESHRFTETISSWIIPANPKFYDVISYFNEKDTILWREPKGVKIGDKVYLYLGAPYSAILYKCEVIETGIPYQYQDENLNMTKTMKIKLVKRYEKEEYPFHKLKEYGVRAIRGPRHMTESLEKVMD